MRVSRPRPVEAAGAQARELQPISVQVGAAKEQRSLRQGIEIKAGTKVGRISTFPRYHH